MVSTTGAPCVCSRKLSLESLEKSSPPGEVYGKLHLFEVVGAPRQGMFLEEFFCGKILPRKICPTGRLVVE